ncbi:MAG: hypothetical protein U0V73_10290 [Acidimicrobiia bacterium]
MSEVTPPRRHPHRRRNVILLSALGVVVIGVVVLVVLWNRQTSRPVKVSEAIKRFHASSTTTARGPSVVRPKAGVYEYTGSGSDHIATPPKTQDEGPQMPATVTWGKGGCWTFRIDYSTSHWQTWNYCSHNGQLDEHGGQTFQSWDFVVVKSDSTSTFTCDPPAVTIKVSMQPGDTWRQACQGTSTAVSGVAHTAGPYRYVGTEQLTIGGKSVDALRFHQERTMSGSQTGTQVSELWFARDGLPLRNERKISVDTSSPIGTITYTEDANFALASLTPHA